jgi:dephospho-CoA kinase
MAAPTPPRPTPGSTSGPASSRAGSSTPGSSRIVGVFGGIASGKSAVARLLAGPDGVVIEADRIAREVLETPGVRFDLLTTFGGRVFDLDGKPDRGVIARTVFASPALRAKLEAFTHPPIRAKIRAELQAAREAGTPVIVLDVPLLLENESGHGLLAECDETVFVDARDELREARASATRGWRPGEVARREAAQMPLAAKRARAGRVVENHGSVADLEAAVAKLALELGLRRPASS